jgi:hypothetical protein
MEPREVSESEKNLEKDVTLNTESASEKEVDPVKETEAEKSVPEVDKQEEIQQAEASKEAKAEVEQPAAAPEEKETAPVEEVKAPVAATEEKAPVAEETEPEVQPKDGEAPVDSNSETSAESAETVNSSYVGKTKAELVEALEELSKQPIDSVKDAVAQIKGAFFNIRKEEIAKEKEEFLANGNEEAAFAVKEDDDEKKIKDLLNQLKEKKAEYNAEQDAIKAENLEKKTKIIDEINAISDDPDNINRQYNHVQQLQQDFKATGEVPATKVTELWKSYQLAVERFYDLLKMNKELRDYDFKKNLEVKQQLCTEAESLDEEENVVDAFKKLQALHDTWRETGPVAKEIREELWSRFKNASAIINKKYQNFFEGRKVDEKANADAKEALCEKIEAIKTDDFKSYAAWDEATKQIIALQAEWKKLGFAARKVNATLFTRFRKSCDDFFGKKAEFFKSMKESLSDNLTKKLELCEKAEALKDSTDWKKTTDAFVELQKEWKTIGPVVKKYSDSVWKRFIGACDAFFEEKKKQTSNVHSAEHDNLKNKKKIIASINEALESDDLEAGAQKVRDLMTQWQSVGHVPFKDKDKIYADYKEAIDKAFDKFDMKSTRANLANFESSINQIEGTDKVYHERERLVRTYEQKCNELKTYENNMGFFNARSTSGNTIVKEMEQKVSKLKEEIALLEQKIKMIDNKI